MNQVGERILFVADGETVTTHVQIQYAGKADDFAWVLPVPATPELSVSHNELFRQLMFATQPFFVLQWDEDPDCGFGPPVFVRAETVEDGGSTSVDVVSEGRVGPYETVVISSDDAGAIIDWLTDNDYRLGDLGADLLQPYVAEGFQFLALRLAANLDVGDLQPIAMTYPAENPGIPIRLTAVATEPNLSVLVWVLGEARAIPKNYLHAQINEALIDWFNFGFNYPDVVTQAADEAGGQAFVTDYAGVASVMERTLFWEGRYDIDKLGSFAHPADLLDGLLAAGFPSDGQMQTLLRRHIPIPQVVLEEGVLQVVFRGDRQEYDDAVEEGILRVIAERSFYNNMRAYDEWSDEIDVDLAGLLVALDEVIVTPLRESQQFFADHHYLTRLFTTLSAEEMTVDPMFGFNPDLPEVANLRTAGARFDCSNFDPENPEYEKLELLITLSDGREVRSRPFAEPDPGPRPEPAVAVIERMDESGPPVVLRRLTAVEFPDPVQQRPIEIALWPNRPNPFNAETIIPFNVPNGERATSLTIFNLTGQAVRRLLSGSSRAGYVEVAWDGLNDAGHEMGSGVYFARLERNATTVTRKLLLLR